MRRGDVDPALFAAAHKRLQQLAAGFAALGIAEADFIQAAAFCRRHELGLRAGDALHLAVAAAHGSTLATLDQRMIKAAGELGVPVAEL